MGRSDSPTMREVSSVNPLSNYGRCFSFTQQGALDREEFTAPMPVGGWVEALALDENWVFAKMTVIVLPVLMRMFVFQSSSFSGTSALHCATPGGVLLVEGRLPRPVPYRAGRLWCGKRSRGVGPFVVSRLSSVIGQRSLNLPLGVVCQEFGDDGRQWDSEYDAGHAPEAGADNQSEDDDNRV